MHRIRARFSELSPFFWLDSNCPRCPSTNFRLKNHQNPGPQGLVGNKVRPILVRPTFLPLLLQQTPRICLQDPLTGWLQKIPALPLHLGRRVGQSGPPGGQVDGVQRGRFGTRRIFPALVLPAGSSTNLLDYVDAVDDGSKDHNRSANPKDPPSRIL